MFPENLLSNAKFLVCLNAVAAGVTTQDGVVIDMAQDDGYDGILISCHLGDVLATAVIALQLQGSDTSDGAAPSLEATTGNLAAAGATDQDNKLVILDTRCPAHRFVFARVIRATANVVIQSVTATLYKARKLPVTQSADVFKSAYNWVLSS